MRHYTPDAYSCLTASFEVVCSTIHRAGFNAIVVVLYRPGTAPLTVKRVKERRSARWYDSECRQMKRRTRRLERKYRRIRTDEAWSSWREQFANERRLFQAKFTKYWLEEIEACRNNPRQLWQRVDELLQAPQQNASPLVNLPTFSTTR